MTHVFLLQAIDAQNAKFDREILLHGKNLSEEEFEKLMNAHKAEIQSLEANLDREKQRQKKTLNDKVCLSSILHCENSSIRSACFLNDKKSNQNFRKRCI